MKAILNLRKSIIYVAAFAAMFSLASCSDDDDEPPTTITLSDVNGDFKGKMAVNTPVREAATPGYDIEMTVESGKIKTDSIPLSAFITVVEKGVENIKIEDIVKTIKAIPYEVSYTGKLNPAQDSIYMTVTAAPIEFEYSYELPGATEEAEPTVVERKVNVTLKATTDEKSNIYSIREVLKVNMNVEEIKEGEKVLEDYEKQNIVFDLKKK